MSCIETLQREGTQNLQTRLDDLRLDDRERVASAIHEIRVAAEYARGGRRVFFIPEAGSQTPDLLIDDCLEVECKHKTSVSPLDKARFELYGILGRRLRSVFPEHITHSALLLEAMFHVEPNRDLVDSIVSAARLGLRRAEPSRFSVIQEGVLTAHFETIAAGHGPRDLMLPRGASQFDRRWSEAVALDEDGTLGRFINADVGCDVRQDRVKGVLKSIRAAARQFSGRFPAIVSVDISAIVARDQSEEIAHLREDILGVLKSNTTISRVELFNIQFVGELDEQSYYTSVQEINNPDARHPL